MDQRPILTKDANALQKATNVVDMKQWFVSLNQKISPDETQKSQLRDVFEEVNKMVSNLFDNVVKLLPIGSYLNGSTRKRKLEADVIVVTADRSNVTLEAIQERFETMVRNINPHNDQAPGRNYTINLFTKAEDNEQCLIFTHMPSACRCNLYYYNDSATQYENQSGKVINKQNSLIFHSLWLDDSLSQNGVSEEIIKIMRLVREWKDKQQLQVSTEI
jgi:hypothetical protein